jgi:hypothetical protein
MTPGISFSSQVTGSLSKSPSDIMRLIRSNSAIVINAVGEGTLDLIKGSLRRGPRLPGDTSRPHLIDTFKLDRARPSNLMARVSTDSEKAVFRDLNTRPHVIVPKNAKVLRFFPRGSSVPVFRKYVSHPGTQGNFFWRRANEFSQEHFEPMLKIAIDAALDGQGFSAIQGGILSGLTKALAV